MTENYISICVEMYTQLTRMNLQRLDILFCIYLCIPYEEMRL